MIKQSFLEYRLERIRGYKQLLPTYIDTPDGAYIVVDYVYYHQYGFCLICYQTVVTEHTIAIPVSDDTELILVEFYDEIP